jgi:hypothetical protein
MLEPLLPITLRGPVGIASGEFHIEPSRTGPGHPVASVFAENRHAENLPPLPGRLTNVSVTAGAEVPLVLDVAGEKIPFCAIHRRGRGVAAVVLAFPLWQWRLSGEEGRALYDELIGGLIQYLAEDIDAPFLDVTADRSVYRTGEMSGFTVYSREGRFIERLRGEVIRTGDGEETILRTFLFEPEFRREGYHRAVLDPLPPGEYRITVSGLRDGGVGFTGETKITVQPVSVEFLKISRDNEYLRHVADISGGLMMDRIDAASLSRVMNLSRDHVTRRDVRTLRGSLALFFAIVFVFAAEWLLRKIWGLV